MYSEIGGRTYDTLLGAENQNEYLFMRCRFFTVLKPFKCIR